MKMNNMKCEIDNWLKTYFSDKGTYNKIIYESMEYSLEAGGKRIRPILMIFTYNIYKRDYKKILPIACALEMIHTYSLIHDDLPCMDDDDLRRGKPTNHKMFGEAVAVLAGDGLLNEASNLMFDYCRNNISKNNLDACTVISKAAGVDGMIAGQVVDIINEGKDISEEELCYMHINKTGQLIKSAIVSGALLANAHVNDINILKEFGEKLGLAFQIKDDILDVIGNAELLGKNIKSDDNKDKNTFVSKFGLEKCKELCENLTLECLELLDKILKDTKILKEMTLFLLKREF
ncbi:polyprenyl synthetase family protein [Clostridium aestuarii]|uniref:Polyprenyl synthetase family protein n=1 Tax=Clostridium aestuarii TaxID=338193 RepID=A0ABT4CY25_9CLOT|nr:farnesyl diphosphate synthase [Clostridium aestuarii]MCY6483762.1 polyprenyl synthetase family protein [Clostridium aestuarii]